MENEERGRPRLTAKGERTRTRIVAAAARLICERGVASTTLDDVKAAAGVSGSQMYHYFPDTRDGAGSARPGWTLNRGRRSG